MFDVRLREFASSGTRGRVLPTVQFTTSIQESSAASLKFSVSEKVAGRLVAPFLVGVEFSTGGAYTQPRNGLFFVTEEGSDTADASETVQFTAQPFVPWLLEGMHVRGNAYTGSRRVGGGDHEWPNATPGRILRSLIDHGKTVDGWAPMLTMDFSATQDSAGVSWTNAERWSPTTRWLTSIGGVLESHVNAGLVDWWAEGAKLRVFRPGAGTSLPNVKLGGPGFQRMPTKRQYEGQFTWLTAVVDDGLRYYENPGADFQFGRRHATATLSGVKLADVDRIVAPMLVEGRTPRRELSYEWTPAGDLPVPWVDFQVGDGVKARDRDGWTEQRVLGITVSKTAETVTVRATVGAKLLNRLKRAVEKAEGGSLGQILGGTGATVPAVRGARPVAPAGLHVASNSAVWLGDGSALTSVALEWDEVTEATDGALLDGVAYELWGRRGSEASARLTATDALAFTVQGWEPDVPRYVKVRALDADGRPGAFSGEIAVTPVTPASIIPKAPTGLAVTSNVGAFQDDGTSLATVTVSWAPVTLSTDDEPVTVTEYEFTAGLEAQRVASASATFTIPTGQAVAVSVRARSSLGVWGDPSFPALSVTGAAPAVSSYTPSVPVVTPGMGGVAYRWDGLPVVPAGFARLVVDTAPAGSGPWAALGAPLSDAGGGTVAADVGVGVFVRFRAFDTLGRLMGTSAVASAVAAGVAVRDIPGLEGELDEVRFTADGKNRIYTSIESPGENLAPNGSFEDGIAPWAASGGTTVGQSSDWADTGNYSLKAELTNGSGYGDVRIGSPSAFPSGMEAGKTYSVTAVVNLPEHDGFSTSSVSRQRRLLLWYGDSGGVPIVQWGEQAPNTAGVHKLTGTLDIPAGAQGAIVAVGLAGSPSDVGKIAYVDSIVVNEGAEPLPFTPGDQWWVLDPTGSSIVGVRMWNGTEWVPYLLVADQIIAAASITAPLIKAGEIEVNHVSPSFGDDLNLSANESVTIIVGELDNQSAQITDLGQGVAGAQAAADAANGAASDAQAAADGAAGVAAGAVADAADVADRLTQHQLYFKVEGDSAKIGRPNGTAELRLAPERIEMTQNNVVVSYWEGGVFVADEARLDSAQIGNHQFMAYGAGRTIVRPL